LEKLECFPQNIPQYIAGIQVLQDVTVAGMLFFLVWQEPKISEILRNIPAKGRHHPVAPKTKLHVLLSENGCFHPILKVH